MEKSPAFDRDTTILDLPADPEDPDPLGFFESETDASGPIPLPRREAPVAATPTSSGLAHVGGPLPLNLILSRLGHVEWTEAVAIVDALCAQLIAAGGTFVPEISRIAITPAGDVLVVGRGAGGAAAPQLARLLHALAAAGKAPAPLRLFVAKWTSATSAHPIAEFATDLAYFASPDGRALIQAVYERAAAVATPLPAVARPKVAARIPSPPPHATTRKQPTAIRLYLGAAAVVFLCVALTIAYAFRRAPRPPSPPAFFNPVSTQATAPSMPDLAAALSQGAGPASMDLARASGSPGAATGRSAAVPVPTRRPASPITSTRGSTSDAGRQPGTIASAVRATLASPTAPSPGARVVSPPPQPGAAGERPARASTDRTLIYSSQDADVTPPVFHQPQLPAQLLSTPRPEMNTLEVIVSETGSVERVRLVSTPRRMADMMLLSGAKNWEFEPARKDGEPVRYRLELSWAATP